MSDNSKYHDTFSGVADAGFADSTWVALDSVIEEVRTDERQASDTLIGLAKAVARADERRRVLRTIHEWAMGREALGYQQLPFGHLYEKLRREGER